MKVFFIAAWFVLPVIPTVDLWEEQWERAVGRAMGTGAQRFFECEDPDVNTQSSIRSRREFPITVNDNEAIGKNSGSYRYFFAINLYNSERVVPDMGRNLWRLFHYLSPEPSQHVFLSIFEDGSTDRTRQLLRALSRQMAVGNIPHNITSIPRLKPQLERIPMLARARNIAMNPLYQSKPGDYDYVVWFNDVFFCASDALKLIRTAIHHQAHIACPIDIWVWNEDQRARQVFSRRASPQKTQLAFYDRWVARTMAGQAFGQIYPRLIEGNGDPIGQRRVEQDLPFQVLSCWNGGPVIHASVFYDGLRFREGQNTSVDCLASECQEICRDAWMCGKGRIITVPSVKYTYSRVSYRLMQLREAAQKIKHKIHQVIDDSMIVFRKLPDEYNCLSILPASARQPFDFPGRQIRVLTPQGYRIDQDNLPRDWSPNKPSFSDGRP